MSKKVLVLSASPRQKGNSVLLCDALIQGATAAGHQAEKIQIDRKKIKHCLSCGVCKVKEGICVHQDDMTEILTKMVGADVIVLATPVYFYSMAGPLKVLIDRTYARYPEMSNTDFYFILAGAAPDERYMDTAIAGLRGFISCVPDSHEKGIIYGIGLGDAGEAENSPLLETAYEMGKLI